MLQNGFAALQSSSTSVAVSTPWQEARRLRRLQRPLQREEQRFSLPPRPSTGADTPPSTSAARGRGCCHHTRMHALRESMDENPDPLEAEGVDRRRAAPPRRVLSGRPVTAMTQQAQVVWTMQRGCQVYWPRRHEPSMARLCGGQDARQPGEVQVQCRSSKSAVAKSAMRRHDTAQPLGKPSTTT